MGTVETKAVEMVSRQGGQPEQASRLVGWIITLAMDAPRWNECKPLIGDIVVELTHVMGMGRTGLGLHSSIGEVVKIEKDEDCGEMAYTILTIEGVEQRWLNSIFVIVSKGPNRPPF